MLSRATRKIFNASGLPVILGTISSIAVSLALIDPALASPATEMTTQRIAAISTGDIASLTAAYANCQHVWINVGAQVLWLGDYTASGQDLQQQVLTIADVRWP